MLISSAFFLITSQWACSDTPAPAQETPSEPKSSAWIDGAVEQALAWEVMPGTTGEEGTKRPAQLRGFFEAHPEYRDAKKREALADPACVKGTEAAHEYLKNPPAKQPLLVEVTGADWKVLVIHHSRFCTSDDWAHYSNEVREEATKMGLEVSHADTTNGEVVVMGGEVEVARHPLSGQGYLLVRPKTKPVDIAHNMSDGVLEELISALE